MRVRCPVEREKRPRDDSDPWNVAWPSDTHRRLEILGDNKVVGWMVRGRSKAKSMLFLCVVDQFVRWFLGGTFRPRTDDNDWCRHIFRESNKAADTHANWLMDNGDSGPGAQWEAPDVHEKLHKTRHILQSFDGARRGGADWVRAAWILWLRDETGSFEKNSYGGRVLRNTSAMTAEREALRMGIERLTVLFPTTGSFFFDFKVEIQVGQYSTNLMCSLCVSPVFTVKRRASRWCERLQNKTKQNKTKQNKTKQNKTKQNKTKQNKTKQNKTKQNKTKQNKTKQNKTKQNKDTAS